MTKSEFLSWLGGWLARKTPRALSDPFSLDDFPGVSRTEGSSYAWVGRDKHGNLISNSAWMTLDGSVSLVRSIMADGWTSFSMWRQEASRNVLVAQMGVTNEPPEYQPDEEDPDPYFTDDRIGDD
jgi:hypothetical protein